MALQRPRFTRYLLAEPVWVPRVNLSRFGKRVIGMALLAGHYAYGVTWAKPGAAEPPPPPPPPPPGPPAAA